MNNFYLFAKYIILISLYITIDKYNYKLLVSKKKKKEREYSINRQLDIYNCQLLASDQMNT